VFLAQYLLGIGVDELPFPVLRLVDLLGRFGVAAQAGFGDLGSGIKSPVQFFEFAVVGGGLAELVGRRVGSAVSCGGGENGG